MNVYVIGIATHPASDALNELRLEEIAYRTTHAALEDAGIGRGDLDHLTIGACDELDGRPISSMLMAAPSGGFLTDEMKVTDSGAMALCLGVARLMTGEFSVGAVASWCKSSKTSVDDVMRLRGDPFFTRPIGVDGAAAEGLFAQAVSQEYGVDEGEATARARRSQERALKNPRAVKRSLVNDADMAQSEYLATPVRISHCAPMTDGAATMILASEQFVRRKGIRPLARVSGLGWAIDSYRLGDNRLRAMQSLKRSWGMALGNAGATGVDDFDVIELECQTSWHEAAYVRALNIKDESKLTPSGGAFAQNPLFCTGLIGAVEAVLQVSDRAGEVQVKGARRAVAQSSYGFAQQGHVVSCFEAVGDQK